MRPIPLTVLNGMAGAEPGPAMDVHLAWGLRHLDLKDRWFGKPVELWSAAEAGLVAAEAARRGLRVATLASGLGGHELEPGEARYRAALAPLAGLLQVARILRPARIRLVAPSLAARAAVPDAMAAIRRDHLWLMPCLREAVDAIAAAGATAVIENESAGSVLGQPDETLAFFAALRRPAARMIWDVGNWWHFACARFPGVDDALRLRPVVGVLHLKGGRAETAGGPLRHAAQLAGTSWDVRGVVRAILDGGGCDQVCLNPPHGAWRPDPPHSYAADLDHLRATFPELRP